MKAFRIVRFLVAIVLCSNASAQDYAVRLHQPPKVGDRFNMEVTGMSKKVMSVTDGDKVVKNQEEEFTGRYDAVETILEVGVKGNPVKVSATVARLTKTDRSEMQELAANGAVIIGRMVGARKVFELNGNPVNPEVAKVLELLIRIGDEGSTDDEIFGTNQRKKIGESWPVNVLIAAKDLEKQAGGSVKDIAGSVTLEAVTRRAEGDAARVSMRMKGTFIPPLPAGFIADTSHFAAETSGVLPVDVGSSWGEYCTRMAMEFTGHATGRSGNKVVMNAQMSVAVARKRTPVH